MRDERLEHAETVVGPEPSERPELAHTRDDSNPGRISQPALRLERGAQIGRYLVVDQLGAGAMGTVYAAYDPELDRKVALKVLRDESRDAQVVSGGRARMLREAQAIARLSHPNVVAVHDVGPCFEHQVFIAMELVDGGTLSAWLRERERTVPEILAVFDQAGHGLAAAHHAGLVHRDFKPDNVLVGRDGRTRVADFGLVREVHESDSKTYARAETEPAERKSLLDVSLTEVGSIMGTPRYMAPEQRQRLTADARADQYSFCISLFEALYGGSVPAEVTDKTSTNGSNPNDASRPANSRRVPAHVQTALQRGLAEDPAARWPTMDELIAELARDPSAGRRRWLRAAGGVGVVGVLAGAVVLAMHPSQATDPCAGAGDQLAGAWGMPQRAALAHAFSATRTPFAADALATVEHTFDEYTAAWTRTYKDSCQATHVRHEQSADLLDRRTECLARHRSELAALVELMKTADAKLVERSAMAVGELPPAADCDDLERLRGGAPLPADPVKRLEITAIANELAALHASVIAGRLAGLVQRAEALSTRARALGFRQLEGNTGLVLAQLRTRTGATPQSIPMFLDAFDAAIASGNDEMAAKVATNLSSTLAGGPAQAQSETWARIAKAEVERLGSPPELTAAVLFSHGFGLAAAGKNTEAAAEYERALVLREKYEPNSLHLGHVCASLANVYDNLGRYSQARTMGERALALEVPLLGPDHPDIAIVYNNLGNIAVDEGKPELAHDYYAHALAIRERIANAGGDPGLLASVIHNLGSLASSQGHDDEALAYFKRAVALTTAITTDDVDITLPMMGTAQILQRRHDCAGALAQFHAALTLVERTGGRDHPYASDALVGIGICSREAGHLDESRVALERALGIRRTDSRPVELAEAELELAKTLWELKGHPRALELAREARAAYATSEASTKELAEVDEWLRAHGASATSPTTRR